jgi:hypothetical protein
MSILNSFSFMVSFGAGLDEWIDSVDLVKKKMQKSSLVEPGPAGYQADPGFP